MAKRSRGRVPKSLLVKMLEKLGMTLTRGEFMGRRRWVVEDKNGKAEYFSSLYNVFYKFKNPKTKGKQMEIEPIVQRINRAIS